MEDLSNIDWEAFAATIQEELNEDDPKIGLKLEIKQYESRFNSFGQPIMWQTGTKKRTSMPSKTQAVPNLDSAFALTKYHSIDGKVTSTDVEVRSPHIREALNTIIKNNTVVTFSTTMTVIHDGLKCIFQYRDELQNYGMSLEDPVAAEHLIYFMRHMYTSLAQEISTYYAQMESPSTPRGIEWALFWMVLKPGDLIFEQCRDIQKIVRLKSVTETAGHWQLSAEMIAYDGKKYGYKDTSISVKWYDGHKTLEQIQVYPLRYHPQHDAVRQTLAARGRKYRSLCKMSYRSYQPFYGCRDTANFNALVKVSLVLCSIETIGF